MLNFFKKSFEIWMISIIQFFNDADDVDAYLVDTLRLVGSEDVGKDEGTVQLLIRKHDDVSEDLLKFEDNVRQLHLQVLFFT